MKDLMSKRLTPSLTVRLLMVSSVLVALALLPAPTRAATVQAAVTTAPSVAFVGGAGAKDTPPSTALARGVVEVSQANPGSPTAGSLPGGASSLQESFEDWQVHCMAQAEARRCTMSQEQSSTQTHQRLLAIELSGGDGEKVDGILILPFGLSLQSGATVQLDDTEVVASLKFRTCLPAGCILPLSLDGGTVAALRKGTALTVNAVADGGAPATFKVSLKGFSGALDRVTSLLK